MPVSQVYHANVSIDNGEGEVRTVPVTIMNGNLVYSNNWALPGGNGGTTNDYFRTYTSNTNTGTYSTFNSVSINGSNWTTGNWVTSEVHDPEFEADRARIRRKAEKAEKKSYDSLYASLNNWQKWFLKAYDAVPLIVDNELFLIRGTRRLLIFDLETFTLKKEVCVHSRVPKYDHFLAVLMHLRAGNKEYILETGNHHEPGKDSIKEYCEKIKKFFESSIVRESLSF